MNKHQTISRFFVTTIFIFSLFSFPLFAGNGKITILHTNDIHGNFTPYVVKSKKSGKGNRELGGFLALQSYVSDIRSKEKNVLLFDAGDFMTGNPICDIEYKGARGGAMVDFFNYLKYDGQTLGNHEFDVSLKNTRALMKLMKYPVFSANLFTTDGKLFAPELYHIYKKDGLRIGVIGVIVDDLPNYINAPQKNQLQLKSSAHVVDSLADVLDPKTDLLIVLSHCGIEIDRQIAQKVGPKIDLIIGGHSHTTLKKAEFENGVLIVQTGSKLRNLGRIDLTVRDDAIKWYKYQLIPLWNEDIRIDRELEQIVQNFKSQIDKEYGRVIGKLLKPWTRSHHQESNIGDFIADVIRDYAHADIAGINSGGIRQNLPAGPIKKLDIKNILPFDNAVSVITVSGKDVLDFVKTNAKSSAYKLHGILQISGLKYEYEKTANDVKILKVEVNGKLLEPNKTYTFATVDFVVANADKYLGFQPKKVKNLNMPLSDLVMQTIEAKKEVSSKVEGRMVKR